MRDRLGMITDWHLIPIRPNTMIYWTAFTFKKGPVKQIPGFSSKQ